MPKFMLVSLLLMSLVSCKSQEQKEVVTKFVGGPCEGCEAIFEYGDRLLSRVDTLPDFETSAPKLKIEGTVFQKDGKTPAEDVLIYIYHTDRNGIYAQKGGETGWGKRHGYLRGWVKTNADGQYTFYTFRPASYPDRTVPEHIHITIKEVDKNEYYIDDIVFEDDPLLTATERNKLSDRCGSGIVQPQQKGELWHVKRDIILGLNIPGY